MNKVTITGQKAIETPKLKRQTKWGSFNLIVTIVLFFLAIFIRFGGLIPFQCFLKDVIKHWFFWALIFLAMLIHIKRIIAFIRNLFFTVKYILFHYEPSNLQETSEFYPERPKNPDEQDEFNIGHIVDRIYNSVLKQTSLQTLIIGIDGRLGIGKSSLMNFIKGRFGKEKEFITVSVNPWLYKDEKAIFEGLFSSLFHEIKTKSGFALLKVDSKVNDFIKSLEFAFNIGPLSMKVPPSDLSIEKAKNDFEDWFRQFPWKVLIFIDDLERCDPKESLLVFKLLREFLYIKKFIFIVGYNKENLQEKFNIDVEKFVDLEIPLGIEKESLWNWFHKLIKKHKDLYEEIKDIDENDTINNDFNKIFYGYCNTPRKCKQILNDLIFSFPIVKGKVYFPHFAMLTIMRRDIPSLYNLLADGLIWLLQEDTYKVLGKDDKYFKNEVEILVKSVLKKETKEADKNLEKRIYEYLEILSYEIYYVWDRETSSITPGFRHTLKDESTQKMVERMHDKAFFRKNYTEAYFIWRPLSHTYTDDSFDVLLNTFNALPNEESKIEKATYEIERVIKDEKLESLLGLIQRNDITIYDRQLDKVFIQGLARIKKFPYGSGTSLVKTALSLVSRTSGKNFVDTAMLLIQNSKNPVFLSILNLHLFVQSRFSGLSSEEIGDVRNTLKNEIQKQYSEILAKDIACPFEVYGIDNVNQLEFLRVWGDIPSIVQYLENLDKKDKDHAKLIKSYIKVNASGDNFYKNLADALKI